MSLKNTILSASSAPSGASYSRIRSGRPTVSKTNAKPGKVKVRPLPQEDESPGPDAYQDIMDDLIALIAPLRELHRNAVEAQAPTVRKILRNGSQDSRWIECTLDHLLDHACIPQGLALFKSLCRYYWEINPQATASYIYAYREMWDSDEQNKTGLRP